MVRGFLPWVSLTYLYYLRRGGKTMLRNRQAQNENIKNGNLAAPTYEHTYVNTP